MSRLSRLVARLLPGWLSEPLTCRWCAKPTRRLDRAQTATTRRGLTPRCPCGGRLARPAEIALDRAARFPEPEEAL